MKYKAEDKVKIKENNNDTKMEAFLKSLDPPYVLTIVNVINEDPTGQYDVIYEMREEEKHYWHNGDIENIYKEPTPIDNRFEILDL